ncbi:MAG TPA: bifunctional oligoribonuclease/PAP phosphatase NrnA [Candidatus Bariatricus faecipullorum]|nr:bifunctional oligoribonuclease/PAP phosphatase NrnA [Candidatus Bariatricus faecipullorum]
MSMLIQAVERADRIAIGGHVRPDGDCVGACMGVYNYIREQYPGKEISVYLEDIPNTLKFMQGTETILHEVPEGKDCQLFIALDCGDMERLGFSASLFKRAERTLCIDHHISNQSFATENYIHGDASSTCELICQLLPGEKISRETAECLYTGIVHDTGVFRYTCTSPETMRMAAFLMEKGIDCSRIITETFDEKTYAQNQVLGRSLLESFLFMDGHCIVSSISKKVMKFYGVQPKHLDGIVSQLKLTKGVDVAIFMYEVENGVYKVSLRSSDAVDVSRIAQYFGGGGHVRAAGYSMKGTVYDVINNLSREIEKQLCPGEEEE